MVKYQCQKCKYEFVIRAIHNDNTIIYCPTCSIPMQILWEEIEMNKSGH
ncbi:hypothetical protein J4214_01350 [Candidatus Woesearchaeota archaeon]|nr:hypothetical protein [Candidatus Woesearchaeota archaeon]